ncbi:MAG: hypothetical protein MMC23_006413 [Stictis urceolatum]|nr:hypothetical protein [Stictis urceolata]
MATNKRHTITTSNKTSPKPTRYADLGTVRETLSTPQPKQPRLATSNLSTRYIKRIPAVVEPESPTPTSGLEIPQADPVSDTDDTEADSLVQIPVKDKSRRGDFIADGKPRNKKAQKVASRPVSSMNVDDEENAKEKGIKDENAEGVVEANEDQIPSIASGLRTAACSQKRRQE